MTALSTTGIKAGLQDMDESLEREVNLLHAGICQGLSDPKRILMLYALRDAPCTSMSWRRRCTFRSRPSRGT